MISLALPSSNEVLDGVDDALGGQSVEVDEGHGRAGARDPVDGELLDGDAGLFGDGGHDGLAETTWAREGTGWKLK